MKTSGKPVRIVRPLVLSLILSPFCGLATAEPVATGTAWRDARDHGIAMAIDPEQYECGATSFDFWIGWKLSQLDDFENLFVLLDYGVLDWAAIYSIVFDNDASDETIGVKGEHTKILRLRHKDCQRFWDVDTSDVLLQGMHGAVIADDARMVPTVQFMFGVDEDTAREIVDEVQGVIESDSGLGYDNPLLTLNAFAFTAELEDPILSDIPDKIVMGDGILDALADMGLGASGPEMVHAHEFAHHVQFELGIMDDAGSVPEDQQPEYTRRIEMMADTMGAYHCAHVRGANFQAKRFADVMNAAYVIGDCAFEDPGHHGTPNQRYAAAALGQSLADFERRKGLILSPSMLVDRFDQALPVLLDAAAPGN